MKAEAERRGRESEKTRIREEIHRARVAIATISAIRARKIRERLDRILIALLA
jgi:hypothetical protein